MDKLKKKVPGVFFAIILLLFNIGFIYADQIATTNDGKKVKLKDSGTWSYMDSLASSADSAVRTSIKDSTIVPAGSNNKVQETVLPAESKSDQRILMISIISIGLLLIIIAIIICFFTIIQPAKKRKKLMAALTIVQNEQEELYNEVEKQLTEVVSSGLKPNDLKEAYFARAFVRAKTENFSGCASDLESADREDACVIFLDLWVHLKLLNYKKTFDLYEDHKDLLATLPEAKKIMSVACYQIGKEHWERREIKESIPYFNYIRKLDVFADKIPESIGDQEITLGIMEMLEGRTIEAGKHFDGAITHAKENNRSTLHGVIGKLLCRWRNGEEALVDSDLATIVVNMEKETDLNYPVSVHEETPLSNERILLRNIHLLYSISLLHYWLATHETGIILLKEERDELEKRLKKVTEIDLHMSDPKLILGLIDYWFFNDNRKSEALKMLEESQTTIPEVIRLLSREKANEELEQKKLDNFLAIVKDYVNNNEIPLKIKLSLLEKLERFSKFKDKGISISQERVDSEGASIASLQNRQAIMRKKMDRIVKSISVENKEKAIVLNVLMSDISVASQNIQEQAQKLETSEQELLINTGEFLLRDEEVPEEGKSSPRYPQNNEHKDNSKL